MQGPQEFSEKNEINLNVLITQFVKRVQMGPEL